MPAAALVAPARAVLPVPKTKAVSKLPGRREAAGAGADEGAGRGHVVGADGDGGVKDARAKREEAIGGGVAAGAEGECGVKGAGGAGVAIGADRDCEARRRRRRCSRYLSGATWRSRPRRTHSEGQRRIGHGHIRNWQPGSPASGAERRHDVRRVAANSGRAEVIAVRGGDVVVAAGGVGQAAVAQDDGRSRCRIPTCARRPRRRYSLTGETALALYVWQLKAPRGQSTHFPPYSPSRKPQRQSV